MRVRRSTDRTLLQLKGEIDSDLTLVFEVWVGILAFNYKIGPFRCNLLDLEKDPCTFDIHLKYLDGQGGIYPEEFPDDPGYVHLCLKVYGKVQIPYTRVHKNINFDKCFYRFPKPDDTVDADA